MEERGIINKILGDFTNELLSYLERKKIIKKDNRKDNIERWAEFVIKNPKWKKYHTKFLNVRYYKVYKFIKELAKTKAGQKKIVEIYGIKNLRGYPKLLNRLQ